MNLQPDICAPGETNVVALRTLEAKRTTLSAGERGQCAMIHFYQPDMVRQKLALRFGFRQAVGDLVDRVAVWVNRPKHLDRTIATKENLQTAPHTVVWHQHNNQLYLVCQRWNPDHYFVLAKV